MSILHVDRCPGVSAGLLAPHGGSAGVSRLFWALGPHWEPLHLPVFPPRLLTLYSKVALGKKTSVSMMEPKTQFLVQGDQTYRQTHSLEQPVRGAGQTSQ